VLLFIEENAAIMNDKEKPCQQILKNAPRILGTGWTSQVRTADFGKSKSKFWNQTGLSSKPEHLVIPGCGAAIFHGSR
jgi:hypothetical protein